MKKIISLYQRNYNGDRLVRDELVPGAEWVAAGEGIATQKFDGTCCMILCGVLFKRYDAKHGKKPPADFEPAQDPDPITGHWPGWIPVDFNNPENRWHVEVIKRYQNLTDGTYELCGPKIQGNPENLLTHMLLKHGSIELPNAPRNFNDLRYYFTHKNIEGIVWHHPDGRMVKIKARDFGIDR